MNEGFLDFFSDLPDNRDQRYVCHPVEEILLVVLCGVICGCDGWEDFELFGHQKLEFLKKFLPFKNGIPSDDTFRRFFRSMDYKEFEKRFRAWVTSLRHVIGHVIAIDGKTSRGSHDCKREIRPLHMVSAFATEANIVLCQTKTDEKSNEITAIPELLEWLDLNKAIVTIDAAGCQKNIAKQIINKGGNYVLALKGNQGNLSNDVQQYFENKERFECHNTVDKGHGRIEERKCYATDDITWLRENYSQWTDLKSWSKAQGRLVAKKQLKNVSIYQVAMPTLKNYLKLFVLIGILRIVCIGF